MKKFFYLVLVAVIMVACASMKAPIINQIESLDNYKYIYITPTSELTSGSSGIYGGKYGLYGGGST